MIGLEEQLKDARQVLRRRESELPAVVRSGRMSQEQADHLIECARGIVATVERAKMLQEVGDEFKTQELRKERGKERV